MIRLVIACFLLVLCSALLTKILLILLRRKAVFDHPNERSSHHIPTPRGGGIAVIALVLCVWGIYGAANDLRLFWVPLAAVILLAGISWIDDLKPLSVRLRLAAQTAAVALALPWVTEQGAVFQGLVPVAFEWALLFPIWIGFINFFNFMDGIDGITGVESISIGTGLAVLGLVYHLPVPPPYLGLSLAAAMLGFLVWNWHPAKIFLGDVGSISLGFLFGGLLFKTAASGYWAAALILPLYYLADAGLTLIMRAVRGEKFWQAHRQHFYQKATVSGRSHAKVSFAILLTNTGLVLLACWSISRPASALALAFLLVALLLVWMGHIPRPARA